MDPVTAYLAITAVVKAAPLLTHGLDTAATIHRQRVPLRETKLRLENERIMQLEAWRQKRATQLEAWRQKRAAQLEAWQQKRSLTELTLERAREMQLERWQQQQLSAREAHRRAIELIELNERSQQSLQEFTGTLKNWPLAVLPSQVVQFAKSFAGEPPLTVLIAPPCWKKLPSDWDPSWVEPKLSKGVSDFLCRFFPFSAESPRPVRVLGGGWKENGLRQQAAIAALFYRLKGHPTLVLNSEVIGDELHLSVGLWNNEEVPTYVPSLVFPLADRSVHAVMKDLVLCHRLISMTATDLHFLSAAELPPQLPKALPELLGEPASAEFSAILGEVAFRYREVYEVLIARRPAWRPEIELDLAESLAALPDRTFAWEQVDASMRDWLALRGAAPEAKGDVYPYLLKYRKPRRDHAYFERLDRVRRAVAVL